MCDGSKAVVVGLALASVKGFAECLSPFQTYLSLHLLVQGAVDLEGEM